MVYVRRDAVDEMTRTRAAIALHPETAYVSHHSAARLFGLPVPTDPREHITVLAAADRRQRLGIRCHVTTHGPSLVLRHGMPVSHPFQIFLEMAGVLDLVNLVVLGDAMVRVLGINPEDLVEECRLSRRHHAFHARRAAEYVRVGVDSPMESRLRMLIVLAGLPEPVVNHALCDDAGRVRRRLDLSYPRIKLIVEYDGRQHAASSYQWGMDLDRREEFDDDGWRILVVRAEGIFQRPAETLDRIRRQLRIRGWGDVPRLSADWRPYFPGR